MSQGLFDQSSGNLNIGYNGQNASGIADHNLKAVLFIFKPSPNQFKDIAMRPLGYRFDENFMGTAQELTDLTKTGAASNGAILKDFMSRVNFSDYMTPSWQPTMQFHANQLSDKYRFILVLTEKTSGLIGANTTISTAGNSNLRRIYSGYFQDEPFNPATLTSSGRTMNPHAALVITHKTVVGSAVEHGSWGSRTMVNTKASEEVVHSEISRALLSTDAKDNSLHLMTPANCMSSIDVTVDGYAAAAPGLDSDITRDPGRHVFSDTLEQPAQNVAQVVKGIMKYRDEVATRGRAMHNRVDSFYESDFMENDASRMNLSRWMNVPRFRGSGAFELDVDQVYTAESLERMLGDDLVVQDFDLQRPHMYETVDQMQTDLINMYSSLIATVVGPVLNSLGANGMSFVYEIKWQQGQPVDQFTTYALEPHWPMSELDLSLTARAVEMELTKGIFATIFHSKGDFRVEVKADTTGMTVVRLDLIEQGIRCMADFEVPTCLGGLISPLLGDSRNNTANSEQMCGLYGMATGMLTGTAGFNQDDHAFMSMAEEQFNQRQGQLGHQTTNYAEVLMD